MRKFWHWRFRDAPFNQKLTVLSMVSSIIALLLTGAVLIALDLAGQRNVIRENLSILSQVTASNSAAALLFDDPEAARETLSALKAKPQIVSAAIYDTQGSAFATFQSGVQGAVIPEKMGSAGTWFDGDFLILSKPIVFEDEEIGGIYLQYDSSELSQRLITDLAVVGAVLSFSFLGSIFLSGRLKRITSEPILNLAHTARQVKERNDYSLRATKFSEDELGKLTQDFNSMLEEVQRRDIQKTEAEKRFAFIAEASTFLGQSLDDEETMTQVARACIPYLADWCMVDLIIGPDGKVEFPVFVPEEGSPLDRLSEAESIEFKNVREKALRSGRPEIRYDAQSQWLRAVLSVPLVARGNILGVLTFVSRGFRHTYKGSEAEVANDLVRRLAFAIDNIHLYRDAEKAIRLRDEFIAIASHELKTPLTTLQLQVQNVMRMAISGTLQFVPKDRINQMKETVEHQISRYSRLVRDLLDVSRVSMGDLKLDWQEVRLSDLVRGVVEEMSTELERAGCKIEFDMDETVVGRWDRFRIEQAVTNLLTNAAKYGAGRPIVVKVSRKDGMAVFSVRDFGIGIAPPDQSRIFDRFERAVSVRHFGGFGLGLFIARQNVVVHGGRIWVESAPHEGATFSFEIPLWPGWAVSRAA